MDQNINQNIDTIISKINQLRELTKISIDKAKQDVQIFSNNLNKPLTDTELFDFGKDLDKEYVFIDFFDDFETDFTIDTKKKQNNFSYADLTKKIISLDISIHDVNFENYAQFMMCSKDNCFFRIVFDNFYNCARFDEIIIDPKIYVKCNFFDDNSIFCFLNLLINNDFVIARTNCFSGLVTILKKKYKISINKPYDNFIDVTQHNHTISIYNYSNNNCVISLHNDKNNMFVKIGSHEFENNFLILKLNDDVTIILDAIEKFFCCTESKYGFVENSVYYNEDNIINYLDGDYFMVNCDVKDMVFGEMEFDLFMTYKSAQFYPEFSCIELDDNYCIDYGIRFYFDPRDDFCVLLIEGVNRNDKVVVFNNEIRGTFTKLFDMLKRLIVAIVEI